MWLSEDSLYLRAPSSEQFSVNAIATTSVNKNKKKTITDYLQIEVLKDEYILTEKKT